MRRPFVSVVCDVLTPYTRELTSSFDFWSRPSPHRRDASSHKIWYTYLYPVRSYWHFFPKFKMAAAAILDFHVMWIWQFRPVGIFVFCTKFGSNICYSHWDRRTYAEDLHLMTSRQLTSGFDFWSRGHLRMAVVHLHITFGTDIFIQSGGIVIFPKFKMATAAMLDFQIMWIWPSRRVDSVVFALCAKFGSNICYSHWDRSTYAEDIHLMTLRELTYGFDFWSRGHIHMVAMHLPIKLGADIFIRSGVIDISPKLKMAAAAILDLFGGAMGPLTKAHSWCVLPVNIFVMIR